MTSGLMNFTFAIDTTLLKRHLIVVRSSVFCSNLSWVVCSVTPHGDSTLFRFLFLGSTVVAETCICYLSTFWNFCWCNELYCFWPFNPHWSTFIIRPIVLAAYFCHISFGLFIGNEMIIFNHFTCCWVNDCINELSEGGFIENLYF